MAGLELKNIIRLRQYQFPPNDLPQLIGLLNDQELKSTASQIIEAIILSFGLNPGNPLLQQIQQAVSLPPGQQLTDQQGAMAGIIFNVIKDSRSDVSNPTINPFLHFFLFCFIICSAS